MELVILLWVIGWLFACGYYKGAARKNYERVSVVWLVGLFFVWPHFLGFGIYMLHHRVMTDSRRMVNIVEDRIKP